MFTGRFRTGFVLSLLLACAVMAGIALYADLPSLFAALQHFSWPFLPLILALTLFNYFGRFIKWQFYLKHLQIALPWSQSLLIFLSGLSMAITPGKAGEFLKSFLLKSKTGTPISHSAPIIVAERLTDGLALVCLATTGLVLYRFGWQLLLALLFIGLTGIILIQYRPLAFTVLSLFERLPVVSRWTPLARAFYDSAYSLLQWRPLLLAIGIGVISWTGECVALYFVYQGLGLPPSFTLFIQAMCILAFSSLVGSATGLPGGLGTADGSMLALSRLLISPSSSLGGAATLLIRLCTLWFGLLIGAGAMLFFRSSHVVTLPLIPTSDAAGVASAAYTGDRKSSISEVQGMGREDTQSRTVLPVSNAQATEFAASSTSAYTGETIV